MPIKSLIPDSKECSDCKYSFLGEVKYGAPYTGVITNFFHKSRLYSGNVQLGALSTGRSKYQLPQTTTPFQHLLRKPEKTREDKKNLLLGIPTAHILSPDEKHNINNDNIRRYFETMFAYYILKDTLDNSFNMIKLDNMVSALLAFSCKFSIQEPYYSDWVQACNGQYFGKDSSFNFFSVNMQRLNTIPDALPGTAAQKMLIIKIYQFHYLTRYLEQSSFYQKSCPPKIFPDLYTQNSWYMKRGRLDALGVKDIRSFHRGILRTGDVAPWDIIDDRDFVTFSADTDTRTHTRCPDRFDMDDPTWPANCDSDSWLSTTFASQFHPTVNGVSGSMILELRFLTFIKFYIRKNQISDFLNDAATIQNYLRIIVGIFVYLEGGHSLNETIAPLCLDVIKHTLHDMFDGQLDSMSPETLLYAEFERLPHSPLEKAIRDAEIFDRVMENRKRMHAELKRTRPVY